MNHGPENPDSQAESALRRLRAQLVAAVAEIDALVPLAARVAADPAAEALARRPLVVAGKCREITGHALARYRERTGTSAERSDEQVSNTIAKRLRHSHEWVLKPRWRVIELLAHGEPSRFYRHGDLLFVVEQDVVVTCHRGEADRWEPRPLPGQGGGGGKGQMANSKSQMADGREQMAESKPTHTEGTDAA